MRNHLENAISFDFASRHWWRATCDAIFELYKNTPHNNNLKKKERFVAIYSKKRTLKTQLNAASWRRWVSDNIDNDRVPFRTRRIRESRCSSASYSELVKKSIAFYSYFLVIFLRLPILSRFTFPSPGFPYHGFAPRTASVFIALALPLWAERYKKEELRAKKKEEE